MDFRIVARDGGKQEGFRFGGFAAAQVNLRQVDTRSHIPRHVGNGLAIPIGGALYLRFIGKLSPQHAHLETYPRDGERRDVLVHAQRAPVDLIGLGDLAQIGEQRTEWHEILERVGVGRAKATRLEDDIGSRATRLIDSEPKRRDGLGRCAPAVCVSEMPPRIREAVRHRCDLGLHKRGTRGIGIEITKLQSEQFESIQRTDVAKELAGQLLLLEEALGRTSSHRIGRQSIPGSASRILEIDDSDLPVREGMANTDAVRSFDHVMTPKRGRRLSSPTLNKVETISFTMNVAWSLARNWARHSAVHPLPFGCTERMPV